MSGDVETYLGGFYSPMGASIGHIGLLKTAFAPRGSLYGAGVYTTNKRLIIIGPGKASLPSSMNKIAPGSDKGDFVTSNLTKNQNDDIIGLLSRNKEFEFSRGQVLRIELKKPSGLLREGWLKITSADGQTLDIRMNLNMYYERAVLAVQAFKPEAVTLD